MVTFFLLEQVVLVIVALQFQSRLFLGAVVVDWSPFQILLKGRKLYHFPPSSATYAMYADQYKCMHVY